MKNFIKRPAILPRLGVQAEFAEKMQELFSAIKSAPGPVGVAYSGGRDSAVLLHLMHGLCSSGWSVHALHIHHGLHPEADAWQAAASAFAQSLDIPFSVARVTVDFDGSGVEASARKARYAALGDLCAAKNIALLLTGHHAEDQAETLLLHLLRGAGVAGLRGMSMLQKAPDLLQHAGVWLGRPLLEFSRAALAEYAQTLSLPFVEDPSNANPQYKRNALRQAVMPILDQHFPGFQKCLTKTAVHMQTTQDLLENLAMQDGGFAPGQMVLSLAALQHLSEARVDNILRAWLAQHVWFLPSTAALQNIRQQILHAVADAKVAIRHGDWVIRRYRGQVFLTPQALFSLPEKEEYFNWVGEMTRPFPAYGGVLHFEAAPAGFCAAWLKKQTCILHKRRGGEHIKCHKAQPTRSLKQHYQTAGIPPWMRDQLPLVSVVGGGLIFAAGIGNAVFLENQHRPGWTKEAQASAPYIALRWKSGGPVPACDGLDHD